MGLASQQAAVSAAVPVSARRKQLVDQQVRKKVCAAWPCTVVLDRHAGAQLLRAIESNE
jgi:hypothetical protein